jgi:hypothetical protein
MAGLATCIEKKVSSTLARMTAQGKDSGFGRRGFRVRGSAREGSGFGVQGSGTTERLVIEFPLYPPEPCSLNPTVFIPEP